MRVEETKQRGAENENARRKRRAARSGYSTRISDESSLQPACSFLVLLQVMSGATNVGHCLYKGLGR